MTIKIERKVLHSEWDSVSLTIDQFIKFLELWLNAGFDVCDISPSFKFEKHTELDGGAWILEGDGSISTSSFESGLIGFCETSNQYVKCMHGKSKKIGQLVSIEFIVDDVKLDILKEVDKVESQAELPVSAKDVDGKLIDDIKQLIDDARGLDSKILAGAMCDKYNITLKE